MVTWFGVHLTCYMSIVLLQLMGLHPLVATFLMDVNFMVVRTDGEFFTQFL